MTTCPTCGQPVVVVSTDEGTSHFAPAPPPDALRAALEDLIEHARYFPYSSEAPLAKSIERARAALAATTPQAPAEATMDVDFDELSVWAVRYTLGRATYAVHNVVDLLIRRRGSLSPTSRAVIVRDIDDALERGNVGMEMDRAAWVRLRAALAQQAEPRPEPDR